jgi:hypothetical protein
MQGVRSDNSFITCPKSLVVAFELAPVWSAQIQAATQWSTWWSENL